MKQIKLFLDAGWLNMKDIIELGYPFTFITGARQIGKTYGALTYLIDNHIPFIYMRRTQKELLACKSDALSPFSVINRDRPGYDIRAKNMAADVIGFYNEDDLICPGVALTTLHNVRGISGSAYNVILYDEFIPEKIARPIKGEFDAWNNAYMTLNSNRELTGSKPMQFIGLANSNAAANPLFMGLGLVQTLERVKKEKRIFWTDEARGILLVNVEASPISQKHKETALGKLTAGTDFARMAFENEYAFDDFSNIESRSLREYKPLVTVGEITIYKHKGKRDYFVSLHLAGSCEHFGSNEREIEAFARSYWRLRDYYLDGYVYFENYLAKVLFIKYTN